MALTPLHRGLLVVAVAGCGCATGFAADGAAGRRPLGAEVACAGFPRAASEASAGGVVALRPPLRGRVVVPGGAFTMGSSVTELRAAVDACAREPLGARCESGEERQRLLAELPAHEVTVSAFELDRTEVTVLEYSRCAATGACPPRAGVAAGESPELVDLPVTYVDWGAAAAYCAWAGGRLPTEAEWEFAARGPEGRQYPWGDVYNPVLCNHGSFAPDRADATDGFAGLAPVGSFPDGATRLGILDISGNVAEWVSDYYWTDERGFGYEAASQVNPRGSTSGSFHVIRGGSFLEGAAGVRGAARSFGTGPSAEVGFRCAANVR